MGKAEITKNRIIELVAPIFNKKGYWATSLSDITEATGLTKGALYGNFKNKEEIAQAAFEFNTANISNTLEEKLKSSNTAHEKLVAYIDFYASYYDTMILTGGCPFMNAAIDSDDLNSPLFQLVQTRFNCWTEDIVSIIKKGKKEGTFKKEMKEIIVAGLFVSLIEGSILLSKTLNDRFFFDQNLLFLKNYIFENVI